ncbi:MAG: hypothetical protein ACW981_17535 [Candidatus Hodarchaeales archaeon]|jgi:hypothetical protein
MAKGIIETKQNKVSKPKTKSVFVSKKKVAIALGMVILIASVSSGLAAPGDLLGTVNLPGNTCSVGGTFDGTYYMTMEGGEGVSNCAGGDLQVFQPPVGGNSPATLISTKSIVDADNNPVIISALAWDAGRGQVWGAFNDEVWLIDIGDPTVSGNALATFEFSPSLQAPPEEVGPSFGSQLPGIELVDGLAYDTNDNSIWYSPDVHNNVYHFASDGTYIGKVRPKNTDGFFDGRVSGVAVGTDDTLYIGRDGDAEIRRVHKITGVFISQFATTAGRVEDLTCDPLTYAPKEAILAKDAFQHLYEAFEVEEGTCPLPEEPATESELMAGQHIEVGLVKVTNDEDNIYVQYTTDGDWVITELHLHIADDLVGIPQTKSGNPKVGHFEFNFEFDTPVTEYDLTKAIDELGLADEDVAIAAHAVVYNTVTGQEETAWADTLAEPFPGKNWAMFFWHELS